MSLFNPEVDLFLLQTRIYGGSVQIFFIYHTSDRKYFIFITITPAIEYVFAVFFVLCAIKLVAISVFPSYYNNNNIHNNATENTE